MAGFHIDRTQIGDGAPCYIIAEIGINHNGDLPTALALIDAAKEAGAQAVKFQKRTVDKVVPEEKKNVPRETPWGTIPYIEYKRRIEFDDFDYDQINDYCAQQHITWFASPWDVGSVSFLERFNIPLYKIASATITDHELLKEVRSTMKPVIMSTGMSSMEEIIDAVEILGTDQLALMNCVATYPAQDSDLNLRGMETLREEFGVPVGHSGHELGLATSAAAVAMGADIVERHITLNRASWGSDQAASLEPQGFRRLVRDIRAIERAYGNGRIEVADCELSKRSDLRGS